MTKNKTKIIAEPGKQEIVITREFDAPRELFFKAFTDPVLFAQWHGPRRLTMTLETFDDFGEGLLPDMDMVKSEGFLVPPLLLSTFVMTFKNVVDPGAGIGVGSSIFIGNITLDRRTSTCSTRTS